MKFDHMETKSQWFEIFKINRDTFAFLEPHHDEEVFSYLLLGTKNAALIDTGMGVSNIRDEVEKLTSLPIVVINTHTHFDHTGDNFRFDEICCFDLEAIDINLPNNKKIGKLLKATNEINIYISNNRELIPNYGE